ncbi:hypothetical protein GOODEAATRI_026201, partial [Goodea atripinnis]
TLYGNSAASSTGKNIDIAGVDGSTGYGTFYPESGSTYSSPPVSSSSSTKGQNYHSMPPPVDQQSPYSYGYGEEKKKMLTQSNPVGQAGNSSTYSTAYPTNRSVSLFHTLPGNRTSIRFLAVGDWGGLPYPPYVTAVQKTTAQEMSKVAEQMGIDFVLALGDNFYYKGVDSVDSPRFQLNFHIPNTGKTLTIVMLDTVMLCGNSDDFEDEKPRGPLSAVNANRQLDWLQERLARSKADFLLVAGHYPVWSVSEHGPTKSAPEHLILFHGLSQLCSLIIFLYLFHFPQYLEESGVGYVVSGAGNFLDPDIRHWNHVPKDSLKFFTGQASTLGGFVHAEVTKSKLILTFVQAKGTSLYRTVLSQREFK